VRVALIGRPGCGKTTLFNALGGSRPKTPHPLGDEGGIVSVEIPDPRLEWLRDLHSPRKFTPARIEFEDTPGLPAGDARGKGELLGEIRKADGLLLVVRAFADPSYPYERPEPSPLEEARGMKEELLFGDYAILNGRVERLEAGLRKPTKTREADERELAFLRRLVQAVEREGKDLRDFAMSKEEGTLVRSFAFASQKPLVVVVNAQEGTAESDPGVAPTREAFPGAVLLHGLLEEEIARLPEEERAAFGRDFGIEEPARARLLRTVYASLGLRSFFTTGEDEVRAWTIRAGDTAVEAAGRIHTDLARSFIRAEVTAYEDLRAAGAWREAKARGKLRLEAKEYEVKDGDIVHIRAGGA
jgi:GTP-binding protein YchF